MTIAAWEALAGEVTPDQSWSELVALLVLDAVTGPASADELGELRVALADRAVACQRESHTSEVASQLRLLVVQLDAAVARRAASEKLSVGRSGRRAQIVAALREAGGVAFTEELQSATGLKRPHLSRACHELLEAGLLLRRTYGRHAEWTLTPLADAVRLDRKLDKRTVVLVKTSEPGPRPEAESSMLQDKAMVLTRDLAAARRQGQTWRSWLVNEARAAQQLRAKVQELEAKLGNPPSAPRQRREARTRELLLK